MTLLAQWFQNIHVLTLKIKPLRN